MNLHEKCFRMPLVTIVTVCRNSESVIKRTIESVLNQSYPNIEYFIIDGASRDATVDWARRYKEKFQKKGFSYTIVSEPDQGIYDAMNKGICRASGTVIGFINAGDWYEADAVSVAAEEFCKNKYDYFFADVNLVRADRTVVRKHARLDYFPTSRHWNHPASFAAAKLYQELGGFRCRGIHDDFEFFLRTRKAGKKIVVKNQVLANFSLGGISNDKSFGICKKRVKDRYWAYAENGYGPFAMIECVGMEIMKYMLG